MSREEILALFPHATWFPGDEPPVGMRVKLGEDDLPSWSHGVVVGRYVNTMPAHHLFCATCTCPPVPLLDGWWKVERRNPSGGKIVSIEYPPLLLPEEQEYGH